MRRTNGALGVAYGDPDEQEDVGLGALPEVPRRRTANGMPANHMHDSTSATRAGIRALRL